jgi:hypothetical protein
MDGLCFGLALADEMLHSIRHVTEQTYYVHMQRNLDDCNHFRSRRHMEMSTRGTDRTRILVGQILELKGRL